MVRTSNKLDFTFRVPTPIYTAQCSFIKIPWEFIATVKGNKKAVLSQRWPRNRNAPYRPTWVRWKFSGLPVPDYAHGYYSQHFSRAFVRIDPLNVPTKFEARSFIRSWDNRGYPQNLDNPWIRPRSLFSKILIGFYSDWPYKCARQICNP